jgi:hypothetical protein
LTFATRTPQIAIVRHHHQIVVEESKITKSLESYCQSFFIDKKEKTCSRCINGPAPTRGIVRRRLLLLSPSVDMALALKDEGPAQAFAPGVSEPNVVGKLRLCLLSIGVPSCDDCKI